MSIDTTPYRGVGSRGPAGGTGPICDICGLSKWVELAGGPSDDVYHPNIDKRALPNVDIVHDLRNGIPLHNNHAERIKFIDVLNYFTQDEARILLREIYRVLESGGSFFLRVVDLHWVCEHVFKDGVVQPWLEAIYHSPDTAEEEGIHRWGYSFESLKKELENAGFINITHHGYYNRWEMKVEAGKP